jgi:hypothetical protein
MKKAILFALLFVAAGAAKAQNPSLGLNQPFSTKDLGIQIDTVPPSITNKAPGLSKLQNDKLNNLLTVKPTEIKPVYDEVFYSTMPVAGTSSRNFNTPILREGNWGAKYTMPVKRIDIVNPIKNKPAQVTP